MFCVKPVPQLTLPELLSVDGHHSNRQPTLRPAVPMAVISVLMFAWLTAGIAQEPTERTSDSVEEVVVYGKKSLTRLRAELHLAEENVFDMFNSLNSNDEFDIHCRDQSQAGTRIKRRVCKPNYAKGLRSEATQRWLNSGDANTTDGQNFVPMSAQIQAKEKQLRAEMELLVMQHPEFLEAVAEYDRARKVMAEEQEKRCKGKRVLCQ